MKSLDDSSQCWNDLLSLSPANNYFLTWEWLWNWWEIYARKGDELAILVLEEGDEVTTIAPLYIRKRLLRGIFPVRRMMFLGTQEEGDVDVGSDYMDLIYKEGLEEASVDVLFNVLGESNICDEIYFSKMDTSAKTFTLIQEKALKRQFLTLIANEFLSPYIQLPATWDDYLKIVSSRMRRTIKDESRKLQNCKNVVFRKTKDPLEMATDFAELARLHGSRWALKGIEGAFSNKKFTAFHTNVMKWMLEKGNLELVTLSEDGQNRAVVYNILYKNKIYVYQIGIEIDDRKISFGYLLHFYCIEEAIKKGLTEYDFLPKGTTDSYKDHFAKESRAVSDIYIACRWAVKYFVMAEELARSVYQRVKPYLQKVK